MLTYADVCSTDVIYRMQVPEVKNEARDCDGFFASLEVPEALQVDQYKSTNTDTAAGSKAQILMQPALPGTQNDDISM